MARNQLVRQEAMNPGVSLRDAMNRLFADAFIAPGAIWPRDTLDGASTMLPLDIHETADDIVVNAALPGIKSEDLNVQVQNGTLVLDANLPAPKLDDVTWHVRELGFGRYHREITLPVQVDADRVEATLENGVLTLRLPKTEEVKPKKIQIRTA